MSIEGYGGGDRHGQGEEDRFKCAETTFTIVAPPCALWDRPLAHSCLRRASRHSVTWVPLFFWSLLTACRSSIIRGNQSSLCSPFVDYGLAIEQRETSTRKRYGVQQIGVLPLGYHDGAWVSASVCMYTMRYFMEKIKIWKQPLFGF